MSENKKKESLVKYEHLLAGISGGVISTVALHPLDLLKVRLAVNDGQVVTRPQYTGLRNAVSTIFRQEGISGFYRGVIPNCWGAGASWGFYFLFYNAIKTHMSRNSESGEPGPAQHIVAASEAGILTLILTNPVWVVKTRLCLQYGAFNELAIDPSKRYHGMLDALKKVYHFEGVRGLYRGFVPSIFGVSHGALQFMAYEEMKKYYIKYYSLDKDTKLSTSAYLSFAAMSKLFAAVITYPYQLIRARLQDQYGNYHGVIDVFRRTWRYERFFGFYKGLVAYLIHVTPNICIVFVIYEHMTRTDDPPGQVPVSKPLSAPTRSDSLESLQVLRNHIRRREDGTLYSASDPSLDDGGYLDDDNDSSGLNDNSLLNKKISESTGQEILDGTNCLDES